MNHKITLGQVMLVKELHTKAGFERQAPRGQFNAPKDSLMVVLYLGQYDAMTLPQFSPNAAMATLGYGPLLMSRTQQSLVDVITKLRDRLAAPADITSADLRLIELAEGAIAAVSHFTTAAQAAK